MTTQELNRDFKRLYKRWMKQRQQDSAGWVVEDWERWETEREAIKKELKRLYYASSEFEYANRLSILIFLDMNNSLRAIPFKDVYAKVMISI